jgi:large subunit ribosomal protein L6
LRQKLEVRKPEPYKGKGVKFVGEVLRRKAGNQLKKIRLCH